MSLIAFAAKTGASIAAEKIVSKKLDEKKQADEAKRQNMENLRKWANGEKLDPKVQEDIEKSVVAAELFRNADTLRDEYAKKGQKELSPEEEEALKQRCLESGRTHIKSRLDKGEDPYTKEDFKSLEIARQARMKEDLKKNHKNPGRQSEESEAGMKKRMFGNDKDKFSKGLADKGRKQPSSFEQAVRSQNANLQNQADGRGLHGRNLENNNQADY